MCWAGTLRTECNVTALGAGRPVEQRCSVNVAVGRFWVYLWYSIDLAKFINGLCCMCMREAVFGPSN